MGSVFAVLPPESRPEGAPKDAEGAYQGLRLGVRSSPANVLSCVSQNWR